MPSLIRQKLPPLSSLHVSMPSLDPLFLMPAPWLGSWYSQACIQAPCVPVLLLCACLCTSCTCVWGENPVAVKCALQENAIQPVRVALCREPRAFPKPPQAAGVSLACDVLAARITHSLAWGRALLEAALGHGARRSITLAGNPSGEHCACTWSACRLPAAPTQSWCGARLLGCRQALHSAEWWGG